MSKMYATVGKDGKFTGIVYYEMNDNINQWHNDNGVSWVEISEPLTNIGTDEEPDYGSPTNDDLIDAQLAEAKRDFQASVDALLKDTPQAEIDSFYKQEIEAKMFLDDPTTPTPYLNTLVVERGQNESIQEIVDLIMLHVDAYNDAHSRLLGKYQKRIKEIEAQRVSTTTA